MPEALTIALEPYGDGVAVVHLSGRFDLVTAPWAREQFAGAVAAGHSKLVIDLTGVEFVDSAGLGALIGGMRVARLADGDLRLTNPNAQFKTLLSLTSVDQVLKIHPTVDAALTGFTWDPAADPPSEPELLLGLDVPATATGMDTVHTALADCWTRMEAVCGLEERWRNEFSLAVAEVAGNIIQYAHSPDPPLVQFTLFLTQYPERLVASFVDRGIVAMLPANPVMPSVAMSYDELGERGRGLALVQLTTDRFEYRRTPHGENIWILEKDFPVATS